MQKKIVGKIRRMKTRPMSQKEGYTFYVNDSISFRVLKSFIDPSGILHISTEIETQNMTQHRRTKMVLQNFLL